MERAKKRFLEKARAVIEGGLSEQRGDIQELPTDAMIASVLGLDYVHTSSAQAGELYLTAAGFAFARHLQPENWYEPQWFQTHRERLSGTGVVYAVPSKPINGEILPLVVKFSRVGERVPIDTEVIENLLSCEFNGPFEEFSLVEELRRSRRGPPGVMIRTQVPLAIYIPPERMQLWQTGRTKWRIANKVALHPGIAIDILRQYLMVYSWLPGIDAWEAHTLGLLSERAMTALDDRASREIYAKGFSVLDRKPEHIIVRLADANNLESMDGRIEYGLVDFELMERTPEYYQEIEKARTQTYEHLTREWLGGESCPNPDRSKLPGHLQLRKIYDVDYVSGRAESTGGTLWVVGRSWDLFEFFLPERWRTTPHLRLGPPNETYFTMSKDNIRLVWKVSPMGAESRSSAPIPGISPRRAKAPNGPFAEVAIAWHLRKNGMTAILPRAIYRTGRPLHQKDPVLGEMPDHRDAASHSNDEEPPDSDWDHITIWDFWTGVDPITDTKGTVLRSTNASQAVAQGHVSKDEANASLHRLKGKLQAIGIEAPHLQLQHILVAIDNSGALVREDEGWPRICLCNFRHLEWASLEDDTGRSNLDDALSG